MRLAFYILILFFSLKANSQNIDVNNNNILYLCYEQKNIELFDDLDDFSEYYPLVNAYYYDGTLELNNKVNILFNQLHTKPLFTSLPYQKKYFVIDSISKDTTINFTVFNKKHTLKLNEIYEDSIQILKFKSIIPRDRIFDIRNKNDKLIEYRLDAPTIADTLPKFIYGNKNLNSYFSAYRLKIYNEDLNENAIIQMVLDENGNITMWKMFKRVRSDDITNRIVDAFNDMPKWKPAKNGNKNIPIKIYFIINE